MPPKQPITRPIPGIAFQVPSSSAVDEVAGALKALGSFVPFMSGLEGAGAGQQLVVPRHSSERSGLLFWSLEELIAQSASLSALSGLCEALLEDPHFLAASPGLHSEEQAMQDQMASETGQPQLLKHYPAPETGLPPYEPSGQHLYGLNSGTFLVFLQHALLLRNPARSLPLPGTSAALLRAVGTPIVAPAALRDSLLRQFPSSQLGSHAPSLQSMSRLREDSEIDATAARCYVYQPLIGDTPAAVAAVLTHLLRDGALKYLCGGRDENRSTVVYASRMFDAKHAGATLPLLPTGEMGLNAQDEWQNTTHWLLGRASATEAHTNSFSRSKRKLPSAFADLRRQYCAETPVLRCLHMPLWHWFRVHLDQAAYAPGGVYDDLVQTWLVYLTPWRVFARTERQSCAPDRASSFHAASHLLAGGGTSRKELVGGSAHIMRGITDRWAMTLAQSFGDFQQCRGEFDHYWRGWVALHYSFYVHLLGVFVAKLRAAKPDWLWDDRASSSSAALPSGMARSAATAAPAENDSVFKPGRAGYASTMFSTGPSFPALEQLERVMDVFEPCVVNTLWQCGYLVHEDARARESLQQQDAGGQAESDAFLHSQSPMARPASTPKVSDSALRHTAVHYRTMRWAARQRGARERGDKLLAGALRLHCNTLGVDASAVTETLLPAAECEAADQWEEGVDDVAETAATVCGEDLQLWSVPEGAALYTLAPVDEGQPVPSTIIARQLQMLRADEAFEVPAERSSGTSASATFNSRTAALGLLVQLLLAIDQRKRALGDVPQGNVHAQGEEGFSMSSVFAKAAADLQGAARRAWAQRNMEHTAGPDVRRMQYLAYRLACIYGLEHVLDQFDAQVSAIVPELHTTKSDAEAAQAVARRTRGVGEYDGHFTHIPVRQDELAWLVKSTQAYSKALVQATARILVPAAQANELLPDIEHVKRIEWLSDWLGCSVWAFFVSGRTIFTENGVNLVLDAQYEELQQHGLGTKQLLVPNFLRALARWRLALLLTISLVLVVAWTGGLSAAACIAGLWLLLLVAPGLIH